MTDQQTLLAFAGLAFTTGGAAWTGVKLSLNGMRNTLTRVEDKLNKIEEITYANSSDISALRSRADYPEAK